ncbi:MAG: sigma-70 family RNA polymerase sigma factor [Lachnospiraceae bacterium]|nr:sigma-70 family RNA polymerase sigma factor [Lachnospiraceae bacterium]MBQ7782001.1 sigma-70 family RNA polymerase sigma factor [Lachnospiraceae bacterium]
MAAGMYEKLTAYIIAGQQQFYRVAYTHVGEREAALDVVQNAICKALENYGSLRNEGAMKTWFYRILINESWNYLRKNKREIAFEPADFPEEIYEEPAYKEGLDILAEVETLPEQIKTIIILHYFEELTLKEIAEVTGMNLNTVKTRLYSGLRKLKGLVQEKEISL